MLALLISICQCYVMPVVIAIQYNNNVQYIHAVLLYN